MVKHPANQAPATETTREQSLLPLAETLRQLVRGRLRLLIGMTLGQWSILHFVVTTVIAGVIGIRFALLVRPGGFIDATGDGRVGMA